VPNARHQDKTLGLATRRRQDNVLRGRAEGRRVQRERPDVRRGATARRESIGGRVGCADPAVPIREDESDPPRRTRAGAQPQGRSSGFGRPWAELLFHPMGRAFPRGALVVQDGKNDTGHQNFKLYRWEDVADDLLDRTPGPDPRAPVP